MARHAVRTATPDDLFVSCADRPTYDVIPRLEAEPRMPVLSADQVTIWAALRHLGTRAVGPYQALLDESARQPFGAGSVPPPPVLPEEQEGWA